MKVAAIDALSLKQAIRKVAFARARKGERKDEWPSMEGVHFEFAPVGESYVVATDNIQLAVSEVRPEVFEKCEFTVPVKVGDLRSVRGHCDVYVGDERMSIRHAGGEVDFPLERGSYPAWRRVVISPTKDQIDFEATDLLAALKEFDTDKVMLSRVSDPLIVREGDRELSIPARGLGKCAGVYDPRRLKAYLRTVGKTTLRAWIPVWGRDIRKPAVFRAGWGRIYVLAPIGDYKWIETPD